MRLGNDERYLEEMVEAWRRREGLGGKEWDLEAKAGGSLGA